MPRSAYDEHRAKTDRCRRFKVLQQATAVPRERRADLPLCWDLAEDLLQMETALRRALCCLPESIETVTAVRGGLESGRPSQTFAGYKLFVTAGRVIP